MKSVYLETTFISYLPLVQAEIILVAAHQQITYDWWTNRRKTF